MSKIQYLDNKKLHQLFPEGKICSSDLVIIDVRAPGEYAAEHIEGSINLPLDEINSIERSLYKGLYKDKSIVFHCKAGVRTRTNQHILESIPCKESFCLEGGIEQWKKCGLQVEK